MGPNTSLEWVQMTRLIFLHRNNIRRYGKLLHSLCLTFTHHFFNWILYRSNIMRERHDIWEEIFDSWYWPKNSGFDFFCQVRQRIECHYILCIVPWAWKPVKRCNARTKKPSIKCVFQKKKKKMARGRGGGWETRT